MAKKRPGKSYLGVWITEREITVWRCLAESYTIKALAVALEISPKTVEFHKHNLCKKLKTYDIAGLTRTAVLVKLIKI